MASTSVKGGSREIIVLVVHGIGEQLCFEQLDTVASNVYRALENTSDGAEPPTIEIHRGDDTPHHSPEPSLRDRAATVRWQTPDRKVVVHFREVHWADLDEHISFTRWWRFVGWALGMAGLRVYDQPSTAGPPQANGMYPPQALTSLQRVWARVKLFFTSVAFLVVLGTIGLLDLILKRLSIRIRFIERGYRILFNYLGDVKLYQDWYARRDDNPEVVGIKSRVAIRARMVRVLLQTASEALANKDIDGFYVFAHSLGTVVAFNALMETEVALPNYLNQEDWDALHPDLKKSVPDRPGRQIPARRPWLDPYKGGCAAVDRAAVFRKLRGFLTVGCPLDRFGAIWPTIVPLNGQSPVKTPAQAVPWINVHDVQDVVAGGPLRLFNPGGKPIQGLAKQEVTWPDQWWLWRAHTCYWTAKKGRDRLIDSLCRWLAGAPFDFNPSPAGVAPRKVVYWGTIVVAAVVLLWLFAYLVNRASTVLARTLPDGDGLPALKQWLLNHHLAGPYHETIGPLMWKSLLIGVIIIAICAVARRIWEHFKFSKSLPTPPRKCCAP